MSCIIKRGHVGDIAQNAYASQKYLTEYTSY